MGMKLVQGERLRSLCIHYGWDYGVQWRRIIAEDSTGLLTAEETYYHEEKLAKMVGDMLQKVESAQEGVIKAACLCRKHHWFFSDSYKRKEKPNDLEGADLWWPQFLSGIKTIAIVPLQIGGVVVFGSLQKIFESMEFVDGVKDALEVPQICMDTSVLASPHTLQNREGHHPCNDSAPKNTLEKFPSRPEDVSQQAAYGNGAELMSLFETHQCTNLDDLIRNYQSPSLTDDFLESFDALSQQDLARSDLCASFGSVTNHQQSNFSSNDFPSMEHQIFEMTEMQQMQSASHEDAPLEGMVGKGTLESNKTNLCRNERCLGDPHLSSSSCPTSEGIFSRCNQQSELTSFIPWQAPESISILTFHEDLASQSTSVSRSFQMNFASVAEGETSMSGFSGTLDFGLPPVGSNSNLVNCPDQKESYQDKRAGVLSDPELFDSIELDLKDCNQAPRSWDEIMIPEESTNCTSSSNAGFSGSNAEFVEVIGGPSQGFLSDFGQQQPVEAVSFGNTNLASFNDISALNSIFNSGINSPSSMMSSKVKVTPCRMQSMSSSEKEPVLLQGCNFEKLFQGPPNSLQFKSQLRSWIDDCNSMNVESVVTKQRKKPEEPLKMARKRARPGESTRPRPKDRQLIQDRVKELREIVPNSTKCSIDALLDRTIKHMIYLQNVTKCADKLKQAEEPKMIGEESGVVLRDNSNSGGGGATWAFEVAGQTMVCPIIVEDLSPPGQMLIEMLCEERGLFLEIADVIRGFGLSILKGVMEVRECKIWSRFLVEASGNVTRMEIFLSLVQLLQQTNNSINLGSCQPTKDVSNGIAALGGYRQAQFPFPISLGSDLP